MTLIRGVASLAFPALTWVLVATLLLQPGVTAVAAADDGVRSAPGTSASVALSPGERQKVEAPAQTGARAARNDSNATNATPVRHRDPSARDQSGDLADVRRWLGGNMQRVLVDCADGIQSAEYEVCDRLDQEYPDWMSKYVEVARETEGGRDDNASAVLNETRRNQLAFARNVRQFRETYDQYRQAQQNGNEGRARELARELQRISGRIDRTGTDLRRSYAVISGNSSIALDESSETITTVQTNVTQQTEEVVDSTFVATELTVTGNRTTVSYANPLGIAGHLETANGTPVSDRQIRLAVANTTVTVETDADGDFSLDYRPRTIREGRQELSVSYRPAPRSVYGSDNASLSVAVEQTPTALTLRSNRSAVAFGDRVRLSGRLTANGDPVAEVPVVLTLNGTSLARTTTDASGSYSATVALPATIPAGNTTLRATLPFSGRALHRSNASTPVTVEPTPTAISVAASTVSDAQLRVRGELRTADETTVAVSGQTVAITVAGETVTRIRTNETGGYAATVAIPESVRANRLAATVTAQYRPDGTNLLGDRASTRVALAGPGGSSDGPGGASLPFGFGGGATSAGDRVPILLGSVALVLALGGGLLWLRGLPSGDESDEEGDADSEGAEAESTNAADESPASGTGTSETQGLASALSPLAGARDALDEERPDAAVVAAYAAVRRALADAPTDRQTHWEFYTGRRPVLDQHEDETLRTLTRAYERAKFAPESVPQADAEYALRVAGRVVPDEDTEDGD